jgi:16S rRNA (guanine527-N7)-methyltransferase
VIATPGLSAIRDLDDARRFLLEDALRAVPLVDATDGPIIDVGSGGGSPGLPIAAALPERNVTLLEAEQRKCRFLCGYAADFPNAAVVWGRAEEQAIETYGVALAKALAKPPVAAELTLPLVWQGGLALLWTGASADLGAVERAADRLAGAVEHVQEGLVALRKTGPTPPGFPRKPGIAKKRPLA